MEKIIKAYKEVMRQSSKDIEAILLVEMTPNFENKEGVMILSETQDEWIIHPVRYRKCTGEARATVSTGNGTYMYKDRYSYEDAKACFKERVG